MLKFAILGAWKCLPDLDEAEIVFGGSLVKNYAILQLVVAFCFILLAIFDYWFFIFHPFEVAIVVDLEEKRDKDRALLRKL